MSKWINYGFSMLLATMLMSCSLFGDKDKDEERENSKTLTEKQLYERVQSLLDKESFDLAVKNLQLLESRFPFGTYAEQSQLEIIYAYYRNNEEDSAIASAERFIRLHANHPEVDYAWYMRGLANYSLKPGLLSRFTSQTRLNVMLPRPSVLFANLNGLFNVIPTVCMQLMPELECFILSMCWHVTN